MHIDWSQHITNAEVSARDKFLLLLPRKARTGLQLPPIMDFRRRLSVGL